MNGLPRTAARFQLKKPVGEPKRDGHANQECFSASGVDRNCVARVERLYNTIWEQKPPVDTTDWSELRIQFHEILESTWFNMLLTFVILFSIVLLIMETDATAESGPLDDPIHADPPLYLQILSRLVIGFYVCEVAARAFVFRTELFWRGYTTDCVIVVGDIVCVSVNTAGGIRLTFLRMIRFFRFLRVLRLLNLVPELRFLLKGIASSFASVLWGIVLIGFIIVSFAIFATVAINPVGRKVAATETSFCGEMCAHAWSSVWRSILTLTQTILFGDSWGHTALEIIQEEPWLLGFFLAAYATVNLASLNLILAAIVDSGAQAREEALESRKVAQRQVELQREERLKRKLLQLFEVMDADNGGTLSMAELLDGYDINISFRETMEALGIDRDDLEVFFSAVDKHNHGSVNYNEFLELVSAARRQGSQQVLTFLKCAMVDLRHQGVNNQKATSSTMQGMLAEIEQLKRSAGKLSDPGAASETASLPHQGKTKINGFAARKSRVQRSDCDAAKSSVRDLGSEHEAEHDNKSKDNKKQPSTSQEMMDLIREQRETIRKQGELIQQLTQSQIARSSVDRAFEREDNLEMPIEMQSSRNYIL